MTATAYRPDIDGLRAVSVLLVIAYHLGWPVSGGFVGVDVFFVISGFLITRLIKGEEETGRFTFADFYARRVRRLFPAIFVTLAASFVAAFFLLLPQDFSAFCASLTQTLLFQANHYFWLHSDYFAPAAETQPLLHMWSLAVEEQFYFVWPAVLILALRWKRAAPLILVVAAAVSLWLNVAFQNGAPTWLPAAFADPVNARSSTIFYLAPFRVFELAIGALLVWLPTGQERRFADAALTAGLALIVASALIFDKDTVWPSTNALVPSIGAALALYGGESRRAGMVLRNPVAVGIGKISYSVYLVHWPLIVFWRQFTFGDLTDLARIMILAVSIAIAVAMYRFVEQPFRRSSAMPRWVLFGGAVAASLVLAIPALTAGQGWLWRFPKAITAQLTETEDSYMNFNRTAGRSLPAGPFVEGAGTKVLIIGDSQARDVLRILEVSGGAYQIRAHMIIGPCGPLYRIPHTDRMARVRDKFKATCEDAFKALDVDPLVSQADVVIMAAHWTAASASAADEAADRVRAAGARRVVIIGNKKYSLLGRQAVLMAHLRGEAAARRFLWANLPREDRDANLDLQRRAAGRYVYVEPYQLLCPRQACDFTTPSGAMIMGDGLHLTPAGATLLAARMDITRLIGVSAVR